MLLVEDTSRLNEYFSNSDLMKKMFCKANKAIYNLGRIISATNKNLVDMVNSGKFRDDLYYRLNVINIDITPLRKRLEDVPDLIKNFLISFYKNTGIYKKIQYKVIDLLLKYK